MKCESPTSRHNLIAHRIANTLESAQTPSAPCLRVENNIDVVLWRTPRYAAESTYRLYAVHRSVLELEHPVRLTLPISELVTG